MTHAPRDIVQGTIVTVTAAFTDESGSVVDPSDVQATIQTPLSGVLLTKTYSGGQITKVATGVYTFPVDTSTGVGQPAYDWKYEVAGTGSDGVREGRFFEAIASSVVAGAKGMAVDGGQAASEAVQLVLYGGSASTAPAAQVLILDGGSA